jgi:glycine dehydrogenase subunit 1
MATTITGRREVLVPRTMSPDRLSILQNHCKDRIRILSVRETPRSGQLDLEDLRRKVSTETAAVYIENPSYLGYIESGCDDIAKITHDLNAQFIVGVEPLSLGILAPPGDYDADIVCGQGQPLGLHPYYGGAMLGFLACRDEERFISAIPHRLVTITKTQIEGEWGFSYVLPHRTMYAGRDKAETITGTSSALWAITSAVYLSLLGPEGIRELAQTIMEKSNYAIERLSDVKGVHVPVFEAAHFEEFTVNLGSKRRVKEINRLLLSRGIIGGKDISTEFPELGNTALYCVAETHSKSDIDMLASALEGAT